MSQTLTVTEQSMLRMVTAHSDLDQDGMDDDAEPTPVTETDGDSLPDYLDIDSDNDGIQMLLKVETESQIQMEME